MRGSVLLVGMRRFDIDAAGRTGCQFLPGVTVVNLKLIRRIGRGQHGAIRSLHDTGCDGHGFVGVHFLVRAGNVRYHDDFIQGIDDGNGSDEPLEDTFDAIGARFCAFVKTLEDKPQIRFSLSLPQIGKFNDFFKAEKKRMQDVNGDRYSASSHRLAWCFLRIAMVLTALRMMDTGDVRETVECADVDFNATLEIIRVISIHNDYIFNVLDRERTEGIAVADSYSAATRKTILAALPGYFKTDDMKDVARKIGKTLRTVRRQVARAIQAGEVLQVKHGEYKKV